MLIKKSRTIYPSDVQYEAAEGYFYDYNHRADSDEILVGVFDTTGKLMNTNSLFKKLDSNTLRIYFPDNTSYTWIANVFYDDGGIIDTAPKKRLFEQDTVASADLNNYLDYRIAFGKAGAATYNVTLADFKTYVQNGLDVSNLLLKSNNLSDLPNKATARTNLNVMDATTIQNSLDTKVPIAGYINSVGSWTGNAIESTPSVTYAKDFTGVNFNITFTAGSTYTNDLVGTVTLTPETGHTIKAVEQVFPVYSYYNNDYRVGQFRVVGQANGANLDLKFYLTLYPANLSSCSSAFRVNIYKQ